MTQQQQTPKGIRWQIERWQGYSPSLSPAEKLFFGCLAVEAESISPESGVTTCSVAPLDGSEET